MSLFNPQAKKVLGLAGSEAKRLGTDLLGTEHLLLGLIRLGRGTGVTVLQKLGVDLANVRAELEKEVGSSPKLALPIGDIRFTPQASKALSLAKMESRGLNHFYVGTEHILLALLREGEGAAARVLVRLGVEIERTTELILEELIPRPPSPPVILDGASEGAGTAPGNFTPRAQQVLALARQEAERLQKSDVCTEHILLGMLGLPGGGVTVLTKLGLDLDLIRREIETQPQPRPTGWWSCPRLPREDGWIPIAPRVKKALALAGMEAKGLNHMYVGTEHILLGLLREGKGVAAQLLTRLGVDLVQTRALVVSEVALAKEALR